MNLNEALWKDPGRMSGEVCFRDTRVPVKTLFDHLAHGELEEFYIGFPNVTPGMVEAVLQASFDLIEREFSVRRSA